MNRLVICALLLVCGRISLAQDQSPPPIETPDFWKDTLVNTVDALDGQYRNAANKVRPSGKAFRRSLAQSGVRYTTISKLKTALDANVGVARAHARTFSARGMKLAGLAFDHGPEFLGNASVGDFREATVVVGNAFPEELATAAGAYVGTGAGVAVLAILGVGGVTVGGPVTVAAIAGGALGGWLGAVSAETIYSAYVSESVKDVVRSILPAGEDPDRFERAVESRKEFLAQEAKDTGNQDAEREFYIRLAEIRREQEARLQQELAEQSETFLSAPGADNPERWKKLEARAKQLAKETAENPEATQAADPDTVPVIPEVAVIDLVFSIPEIPNSPIRWTLFIRGGTVSGQGHHETPGIVNQDINGVLVNHDGYNAKYHFEGQIKDNVITGSSTINVSPQSHSAKLADGSVRRTRMTYPTQIQKQAFTMNADGTLSLTAKEFKGEYRFQVLEGRGDKEEEVTVHDLSSENAITIQGVWQYRDAPVKANEDQAVPK